MESSLRRTFHLHSGTVRQHFSDTLHDLGRVVTYTDDNVSTEFLGVLQHQVESVIARLVAEIAEERDVAADQRLQAGADGAHDRTRAHHDSPHDAEIAFDAVAR